MPTPLALLVALGALTLAATAATALAPAPVAHRLNTAAKALVIATGAYGLLIAASIAAIAVN